jgi:hypothetical protein
MNNCISEAITVRHIFCEFPNLVKEITVSAVLQKSSPEKRTSLLRVYGKFEQIFPEMKLHCLSPNSYIHVSVSDLYISKIGLPILLQENRWTDTGNI